MIAKADYESIVEAAMRLNATDRCRVAGYLWESIGNPVGELEGEALENELNEREADLDADDSKEMSHEDFLKAFAGRRK